MASTLNPYLSFRDDARAAMEFYQAALGGELTISTFSEFGDADAPEANLVMHSQLTTTTEWDPSTVRTERVSGDGGVGTTYSNTSSFMGRETDLTYEVVEHRPDSLFALRGENSSVVANDTMEIAPAGGGSRVTYT